MSHEVKNAIYYAAIIHDLGKTSDIEGAVHGEKSANLYRGKINKFISDTILQEEVLNSVKYHSVDDEYCPSLIKNSIIWKILKDADALDRGRFSRRKCDISYLRSSLFKKDIGTQIVRFMENLPFKTRNLQWENPYLELTNCINTN
jgi:HD superfamily phosphohydrolase YqeK